MYEVFISYTSADERFARFVHKHLTDEGLVTFLAPISLSPGGQWSQETLAALNSSRWVLFLASRAACTAPYVLQEVGAAVAAKKELIPVVWDIQPSQLPGWASQYQALNLAGLTSTPPTTPASALGSSTPASSQTLPPRLPAPQSQGK